MLDSCHIVTLSQISCHLGASKDLTTTATATATGEVWVEVRCVTLAFPPKFRLRFYEQERGHYRCFICQQEVLKLEFLLNGFLEIS